MLTKTPKDVLKLFSFTLALVFIPAMMLWYRNRPYHASNAEELFVQVVSRERDTIENELGQRNSKFINREDTLKRWQILRQSVLEQGATPTEAKAVVSAAQCWNTTDNKGLFLPHWPILIRRGYVKDNSVWFSICAVQAEDPLNAEIVTGWNYTTRVIDPQDTNSTWGTYSQNCTFPRCYGPNTPFPVDP